MIEDGRPDRLNARARPIRARAGQAAAVVALIAVGIVFGARLWQPVKRVEQRVAVPIGKAVKRLSPLEDLPDLVAAACPAVVSLHVAGTFGPAPQGVILTADGYAVTTAALAPDAAIEAWLNDGQRLRGKVSASDPLSGLTLVKLEGGDLPPLALGDADLPRVGGWGFTLVSPAGRGCAVAPGVVASDFATDDAAGDYYVRVHTGGAIVPAGTPFLSADGRVAALARPAGSAGSDLFAPIDLVTTVVSALMRDARPASNPFGILAEDLSPMLADRLGADRGRGAVIVLVGHGSAAEAGGLKVGDVILSAGQAPISSSSELSRALGSNGPIDMVVARGADQTTLTLTLIPKGGS